jgi:hypothetical protein
MPAKSGGTIKSQGQLDGKFKAKRADMCLQTLEFSTVIGVSPFIVAASFQPQPQDERHDRNTSDAGEPESCKPEQAVGERGGWLL